MIVLFLIKLRILKIILIMIHKVIKRHTTKGVDQAHLLIQMTHYTNSNARIVRRVHIMKIGCPIILQFAKNAPMELIAKSLVYTVFLNSYHYGMKILMFHL